MINFLSEKILTFLGFLHGLIKPVFIVNELPDDDKPEKYIYLQNGHDGQIVGSSIKILSWNILRYYNQKQINQTLEHLFNLHNFDIVFIQEAPVYDDSKFSDLNLLKNFNKFYVPLHQIKKQDRFYNFKSTGNLILSKHSFVKTEVYELPTVSGWFTKIYKGNWVVKRIAVYAQIMVNNQRVGLYNIHLENNAGPSGRLKQIKYLLDEIIAKNNDDVVVIAGDFNTVLTRLLESGLRYLSQNGFTNLFDGLRFKFRYLPRLDYFFVKGAKAKSIQLKGNGSDHYPIMAEIIL